MGRNGFFLSIHVAAGQANSFYPRAPFARVDISPETQRLEDERVPYFRAAVKQEPKYSAFERYHIGTTKEVEHL